MSALHLNFPASGAPIYMKCAGQPQMLKRVDFSDPDTFKREEGLVAHWVVDTYLRNTPTIETHKKGIEVTEDMHDGAKLFCEEVDRVLSNCSDGYRVKRETNIEYSCDVNYLLPNTHRQRIDFRHYDSAMQTLYVFEYKYGFTPVDVEEDFQTIYYGFDSATKDVIQNFVRIIIQPRSFHRDGPVRRHVMNRVTLNEYAGKFREQYDLAYRPDAPLVTGKHCHKCIARGLCPAVYEEVQQLATVLDAPASLTPEEVGERLSLMSSLHERAGDAKSALMIQGIHYVQQGSAVKGFKLVPQNTKSVLSNEGLLKTTALMFGVDSETLYKKSLKSQAELKKILPAPMVKMCTTTPTAKLILVPEDDQRDGHSTRAEAVFGTLPNKPEGAL